MTSYEVLLAEITARRDGLSPRLRQIAEYRAAAPERHGARDHRRDRRARAGSAFQPHPLRQCVRLRRLQRHAAGIPLAAGRADHRLCRAHPGPAANGRPQQGRRRCWTGSPRLEYTRSSICGARRGPSSSSRAVELLARGRGHPRHRPAARFRGRAYLGYAFGQLGTRTHLIDGVGGMTQHQANHMAPRDALVAISFAPYAPETMAVAQRRAPSAARRSSSLTDGPLSPLLPMARVAFEIEDAELAGFPLAVGDHVPGAGAGRPARPAARAIRPPPEPTPEARRPTRARPGSREMNGSTARLPT